MYKNPPEIDVTVVLSVDIRRALAMYPKQQVLVIIPDSSAWNDFGKNFRAKLHFFGFGKDFDAIAMRLMFEGNPKTWEVASRITGDTANADLSELGETFISVLAHSSGYQEIVKNIGFTKAYGALRKMHDAIVTKLDNNDEQSLSLVNSIDFVEGVVREDSVWVAMRQGGRYLSPTPIKDCSDAANSFQVTSQLKGVSGKYQLEADFGKDFPLSRRMMVLVGENGLGKSRFLQSIIQGLQVCSGEDASLGPDTATFESRPDFSRVLVFSTAASDLYPLQIPPWSGVDYRFHQMVGQSPDSEDDISRSLLDCLRIETRDLLGNAVGADLLEEMLRPLGIESQIHVEVSPLDDGLVEENMLPNPIDFDGRSYLPFFTHTGERRNLQLQARMIPNAPIKVIDKAKQVRNLSSGEQSLLRFALQAIGSLRTGSLFIFDEPETHLHPRFVSMFMSMLDRLLELSGSVALIATHSSYVVREVPSRRVRVFQKDEDGFVHVVPPRLQTFGASIDSISQFIFSDNQLRHRYEELLDNWMRETPSPTVAKFRKKFRDDLNAETLSYLAQTLTEREQR